MREQPGFSSEGKVFHFKHGGNRRLALVCVRFDIKNKKLGVVCGRSAGHVCLRFALRKTGRLGRWHTHQLASVPRGRCSIPRVDLLWTEFGPPLDLAGLLRHGCTYAFWVDTCSVLVLLLALWWT